MSERAAPHGGVGALWLPALPTLHTHPCAAHDPIVVVPNGADGRHLAWAVHPFACDIPHGSCLLKCCSRFCA